MDVARFAKEHGYEYEDVMRAIRQTGIPWTMVKGAPNFGDSDSNVEKLLQFLNPELAAAAAAQAAEEEQRFREATSQMLISSGFSFDGYKIVKYSGYISGDDCVTIPRTGFFGTNKVSDNLCDALVKIRRQAIAELKKAAYDLGCNAVVGVDFDYITIDPQTAGLNGSTVFEPYVICVTANGNAVVIEKDE